MKNLFRKMATIATTCILTFNIGVKANYNNLDNFKNNIEETAITKTESVITPVEKKDPYRYTDNNERYYVKYESEIFLEIEYKNINILQDKKENIFNVYVKDKNFSKEFYTLESMKSFLNEYLKSGYLNDYTIYVDDLKTDSDLEQYAKLFLKNEFNLELNIPIYFTDIEDDSVGGLFTYYEDENKAYSIQIDNEEMDSHDTEKILIHELVHYALFELGEDFKDGEEFFEKVLFEHGGRSNYHDNFKPLDTKLSSDCCS